MPSASVQDTKKGERSPNSLRVPTLPKFTKQKGQRGRLRTAAEIRRNPFRRKATGEDMEVSITFDGNEVVWTLGILEVNHLKCSLGLK